MPEEEREGQNRIENGGTLGPQATDVPERGRIDRIVPRG